MARTFDIETSRFEGLKAFPRDVQLDHEQNGRAFPYTLADIPDLLADLEAGIGIKQPIICKPVKTEDGKKTLQAIAGNRRLYAARVYGDRNPEYKIPIIIQEPKDSLEELVLNARENVSRKDLSPIDEGHVAQRLLALGMSKEDAGKVLEVSPAQIGQRIKLVEELSERVQHLIHRKNLTADDGLNLLKVPPDDRDRLIEKILEDQGRGIEQSNVSVDGESGPAKRARVSNKTNAIREAARDSGAKISIRMPELKKYLQEAIDEDGPGSNKGEVQLKVKLLAYLNGELKARTLDDWFNRCCRVKGPE